ncbi:carboxypeptidase N subunit 2-like [Ptychodera flava]|uniref:carboxypeptidase N subunit 2-like n=1 Tax=Ptychodera flava TaxID=63121 RepID=UPI00396AA2A1
MGTFNGLDQLTALDLHGNILQNITEVFRSIEALSVLMHLQLQNNLFEGPIPANISARLPFLEELDISYNGITSIHADSFSASTRLQVLDLSNNKISNLPEEVFYALKSLRSLSLVGNTLHE